MKYNHKKTKQKGFTLIEVLLVVSIITFIGSILVVQLHRAQQRGRDAKRVLDIKQIDSAIQLYVQDKGHAPYLGVWNCSASNPSSCGAYDSDGSWQILQTELSPYITSLPKDPCGVKCQRLGWFGYAYRSPASIAEWCINVSCGLGVGTLNSMYTIYAETLELTGGPSGYSHAFADSF
jgi:prepilin-type N-terminal cleavage/methylation domain-containing protein